MLTGLIGFSLSARTVASSLVLTNRLKGRARWVSRRALRGQNGELCSVGRRSEITPCAIARDVANREWKLSTSHR
jgi:hypothetical protein